jgi:hypothetical protein
MRRGAVLLSSLGLLADCDTYAASRYSINADNVVALRQLAGNTAGVGTFTASIPNQSEIMCRAVGPIKTPDGETFSEYVRKALVDEMKIAGAFAEPSLVTINGRLDRVDMGSTSGTWALALTLASSNGTSLAVAETYKFTSSFMGVTACREAANALMPAVQNLVGRVVRHPAFPRLVGA